MNQEHIDDLKRDYALGLLGVLKKISASDDSPENLEAVRLVESALKPLTGEHRGSAPAGMAEGLPRKSFRSRPGK